MKRIVIIASIIFGSNLSSFAQVTESSYLLGASSSFFMATSPNGKIDQISFSIQPTAGKFISEKWLMNVGLGYYLRQQPSSYQVQSSSSQNNFSGMFGMTRFYPLIDKMYFTLDYSVGAGYSIRNSQYVQDSVNVDTRSTGFNANLGVSPGLAYFVTNKWMLFSSFGALKYSYDVEFNVFNPRHSLGYNFQANSFGIGAKYVFGVDKNCSQSN